AVALSVPSVGTLNELGADGHFVYTPPQGFAGVDSFQYVVDDGQTQSAPVTVTITVTNTPPFAADDTYAVAAGRSLPIPAPGLLANDGDAAGDPIEVAHINSQPSNGGATLNADGSFTYSPLPGFFGTDSFTYVIDDGIEYSSEATVTITVTAPPTPV